MTDIIAKRVNRLERLMTTLLATVDRVDRQLEQTDLQMAQTQRYLERSYVEMRATQERSAQEMREFKDEMREFKNEQRRKSEEFNKFMIDHKKSMGELSRKMGTMAEDLVAPSIPRILRQTVGCPKDGIAFMAVRVRKLHPIANTRKEYDVVVVCGDYLLVNETKSRLNPDHIKNFAEQVLPQVREFFPEYAKKKVIGAIASLYVEESVARFGERLGLIVLGFGEDVMDVLNQPGFMPKEF